MIGHSQRNGQAIKRGLKWLADSKDTMIQRGMARALPKSMSIALEYHDTVHFGHTTTQNSYGFALLNYGKVVFLDVNREGRHGRGNAETLLRNAASHYSALEWVGLVLADMTAEREGRKNKTINFDEGYEIQVLEYTRDEVQAHFKEYFR